MKNHAFLQVMEWTISGEEKLSNGKSKSFNDIFSSSDAKTAEQALYQYNQLSPCTKHAKSATLIRMSGLTIDLETDTVTRVMDIESGEMIKEFI